MKETESLLSILTSKVALSQASAGALAQVCATLLLFPLDSVKIMVQLDHSLSALQILKDHVREGNLGRLYHGITAKLVQSPQQKFQYFYMHTLLKTLYKRSVSTREMPVSHSLAIGYLAALQGLLTTLPLDVVTNRMISQGKKMSESKDKDSIVHKNTMVATFLSVWEDEGFASFYRSLNASLILCINPAITYVVFDFIKSRVLSSKKTPTEYLTTMEAFFVGAFSKAVASTVTFPAVRAKTKMTAFKKTHASAEQPPGMIETLQGIVDHGGFMALYAGIGPQISKGILQEALMLSIKERIGQLTSSLIVGGKQ
mmetsp:Transcript_6747/g.7756  ORF Transcript_6747/g.7756 Transcript_6747/m.7756 type:complete len:314 (+) Transcript_6747:134-1075(+)